MINKQKRFQMAFDVSQEMHTEVKVLAAMRNISISLWVQRALIREINRQKRNENQEE
jgi:hypothetical protein